MGRLLYFLLCIVGIAIGLLVANRPRFWWQELFHNAAFYWILPACLAAFMLIRRMLRLRCWSLLMVIAVVAYLYAVAQMGHRARRYVHFSGWKPPAATASPISGLWVDSFSPDLEQGLVEELAERFSPSMIIMSSRKADARPSPAIMSSYPHHIATTPSPDGRIVVVSRLPYLSKGMTELGFNALPGGVVSLELPDGEPLELGVLMLERSTNTSSFERNRISSRRLSALMRNSSVKRIVVGNFNATPFSMFSSIFSEQARMHSLVFGSGFANRLGALDVRSGVSARNVFVSRDMTPQQLEYVRVSTKPQPVVYFSVLSAVVTTDKSRS